MFKQVFSEKDRKPKLKSNSKIVNGIHDDFYHDYRNILYSDSFKRLSGKTQIYKTGERDHLMNRMTHTLYVEAIATEIHLILKSKGIDTDIYLIKAIAIGHDLGHTPYGHVGEREILSYARDLFEKELNIDNYLFKHNIFSVQLIQQLELIKKNMAGYDLTWQVVDGILKHTSINSQHIYRSLYDDIEFFKDNYFDIMNNKENFVNLDNIIKDANDLNFKDIDGYLHCKFPITLEGQIAKVSDEIAQLYHDILDISRQNDFDKVLDEIVQSVVNGGIKSYTNTGIHTLIGSLHNKKNKKTSTHKVNEYNRNSIVGFIRNIFIEDICDIIEKKLQDKTIKVEYDRYRLIGNTCFTDEIKHNQKIKIKFSKDVDYLYGIFEEIINDNVKSEKVKISDQRGKENIKKILNVLLNDKEKNIEFCHKHFATFFSYLKYLEDNNMKTYKVSDDLILNNPTRDYVTEEEYRYIVYNLDNGIIDNKIKKLYYINVINTVARMTENFLEKIIYPETTDKK